MSNAKILDLLANNKTILADGAMGTVLHGRGVGFEKCFDELNLTDPAVVAEVHREYIEAGAQLILTNTFGANRYKLARHGLGDQVAEINQAGVELARRVVAASFKDVFVAGDVGPLGVRIAPYGRVSLEGARAAFAEQITALAEAGADLIVIETVSDLYEIKEAVRAAREVAERLGIELPVVSSMTFTRDDVTLLGDTPAKVARILAEVGTDVIGVNCSGGPSQLLRLLKAMRDALPARGGSSRSTPEGQTRPYKRPYFWVKPNAGWPEQVGGRIMYPAEADYFGEYALSFCQAGASIIGGCCGTTPAHITSMRAALDKYPEGCQPPEDEIRASVSAEQVEVEAEAPSAFAQKLASGQFSIAVEMSSAARSIHPQAAGWRFAPGRLRRGRNQRGRQSHGAHEDVGLGGV